VKVFHLIVGLGTGGAENMLLRLVSALPDHKHVIVSLTNFGVIGHRLVDLGCTVYALELHPKTGLQSFYKLWKLIRFYHPDVIQTWMYHSDLLGGLIGRLAGVRNIIWNVRNTEIPQRNWSITGVIIKLCSVLSTYIPRTIICCAHASMKTHALLGYRVDKMIVIPNGYNPQDWIIPTKSKSDFKKVLELPGEILTIGIVGRYDWLKGYDVFIEAAALLSERIDRNILFVMVGRNIDYNNAELLSIINEKGGHAKFKLMGERNDISHLMYALDIFCLASRAEGFPNVVAEAMLMQVPCVVTDVGDAALIVGETGKVVPPNQPIALADALQSIESVNDDQRQEIGREARRRILKHFDINIVAQRYEKLYMNNI